MSTSYEKRLQEVNAKIAQQEADDKSAAGLAVKMDREKVCLANVECTTCKGISLP